MVDSNYGRTARCTLRYVFRTVPEAVPGGPEQPTRAPSQSLIWAVVKTFPGPLLEIILLETIFCMSMFLPIYLLE